MSHVKAATFVSPVPTRASKNAIHAFAEGVAAKLHFGPHEPILSLVSRIGGKVIYKNPEKLDGRLPESIVVRSLGDFTIFVPSITSAVRDRFTIAHELGHYYLHYPLTQGSNPGAPMRATRWVDPNDQVQQRAEWEANWFAAAFLMPTGQFKATFASKGGNLEAVAAFFGVSPKAAQIRASTLNLL
ncbi:conserved hypothetical protein [Mesorhizobium plurifarium]|uniref:IrrE N-terminal-like domain-containing protein n=1 Tax=Mesorhizobium plurifarium TaxID=69974 RepID=A0A090EGH6_MESPL|nr:conserved hypothetical protein [Mesorhizobium plurifarium]